jgi:primosomal protein N''
MVNNGRPAMTTIKNHLMTLRTDEPRPGERAAVQPDRVPPGPAMDFSREGSNAHRLYERTRLDQEGERASYLASIKKAVEEGTYQPNLEVVAERLAGDLRGGRHL